MKRNHWMCWVVPKICPKHPNWFLIQWCWLLNASLSWSGTVQLKRQWSVHLRNMFNQGSMNKKKISKLQRYFLLKCYRYRIFFSMTLYLLSVLAFKPLKTLRESRMVPARAMGLPFLLDTFDHIDIVKESRVTCQRIEPGTSLSTRNCAFHYTTYSPLLMWWSRYILTDNLCSLSGGYHLHLESKCERFGRDQSDSGHISTRFEFTTGNPHPVQSPQRFDQRFVNFQKHTRLYSVAESAFDQWPCSPSSQSQWEGREEQWTREIQQEIRE